MKPIASVEIEVPAGGVILPGTLSVPEQARGAVAFAHGSGSSRHSSRNRFVACELQHRGIATLLIDLLTDEEERIDMRTAHLRFDIGFLAGRLIAASDWLAGHEATLGLKVAYFGASTGGGAALVAAALAGRSVASIVSRGGRPDLAGEALGRVVAPTLLIVGGDDGPVITMNEEALAKLTCEKQLEIIPGATHLFEEPGA